MSQKIKNVILQKMPFFTIKPLSKIRGKYIL